MPRSLAGLVVLALSSTVAPLEGPERHAVLGETEREYETRIEDAMMPLEHNEAAAAVHTAVEEEQSESQPLDEDQRGRQDEAMIDEEEETPRSMRMHPEPLRSEDATPEAPPASIPTQSSLLDSPMAAPLDSFLSGDDDDDDDRTLLDLFGEAAKDYLTQQVIPPTDANCVWDWRVLRCEPSCSCHLDVQFGDYHLGRACRQRTIDDECIPQDPAWKPAVHRLTSLVTQTVGILKAKLRPANRLANWQKRVCADLWALYQLQGEGGECLPEVPPKSIPEKIFCGPIELVPCRDRIAHKVFA